MTDAALFDPLVPALSLELARHPGPSWRLVPGSMLSADLSGFTALSERLASRGRVGAEEITELMNRCFTALIDEVERLGGEVVSFGGDALLVLVRGEQHEHRAGEAAVAMQHALQEVAAARRAELTMTVGVAEGPFLVVLAGTSDQHLLLCGPRADEVVRLEAASPAGGVLVSPGVATRLPPELVRQVQVDTRPVAAPDGPGPTPDGVGRPGACDEVEPPPDVAELVPAAIRTELRAVSGLGGEHRRVTVGFVQVTGIAAELGRLGPQAVATELSAVVDAITAACQATGATLLHTDVAPDGAKLLLCAGAPLTAGDTADAMLATALAVASTPTALTVRVGVQTGRVFAGFLGSPSRHGYTVMGDPVNTAARMLAAAGDREVVAVDDVIHAARTRVVTDPLQPLRVKGKRTPVLAHRVRALSDEIATGRARTPLVGRDSERALLLTAIGALGVVELVGGEGVGKSRLLEDLQFPADTLVLRAACTPYGAATPYGAFRALVRGGPTIPLDADPRTTGRRLGALVHDLAPSLEPLLPLLALAFGAEVVPTPEVDAIDPRFRRARLHEAVAALLEAISGGRLLLLLEDVHWIDDASGELLAHLIEATSARSWGIVLTRRPRGPWQPPTTSVPVTRITLEPLPPDAIRELVIASSPVPRSDAEVARLVDQAGGSPLFAVELAAAAGTGIDDVPATVEEVVAARLDGLGPDERWLLRIASVFGMSLHEGHLREVAAALGRPADLDRSDLDVLLLPQGGGRRVFGHALYREVAYEGLPFRQRRRLHELVGDTLARAGQGQAPAALLSLHYAEARRHLEAATYAAAAADDAMAAYAHREAAVLLERALTASRWVDGIDRARRAELYEQLGRSQEYAGELEPAFAAYRRARQLTDDLDLTVNVLRRQARIRQKQGRMSAAVRLLRSATRNLDGTDDAPWVARRRAELELNLSGIRTDQGRLTEARAHGEAAERHAVAAGSDALRVQAYGAIAGALTDWGEARRYAELGLGDGAPADAHEARSILAINLGMAAYFAGEWTEAVRFYQLGRHEADTMGNVTAGALAAMNAAEVLVDQGRLDAALEALTHVERVLGAAGYEAALRYARMLRGTALLRRGDAEVARDLLADCATRFRDGSMLLYALEAELRLAEAWLALGDPAAAERLARTCREQAGEVARSGVVLARADRVLGLVALARGDDAEARERLAASLERCRGDDLRYELALTAVPLATLTMDAGLAAEADQILDDLTVDRAGVDVTAPAR